MKVSDILLLIIRGLLVSFSVLLIISFNWVLQYIIVAILFLISGLWSIKITSRINVLFSVVVLFTPFFLIYALPSISGKSYQTFPIWIIAFLSLLCSIVIKYTLSKKITITFFGVIIITGLIGMPNYLNFILQPSSFINEKLPRLSFVSHDNLEVDLQSMKGKILVLDFWSSNCIPCFKKFPELEQLYDEYKNDSDVVIYAVNLPLPDELKESVKKRIDRYNYKFPKLYATDESAWSLLKIESVPALLIIDKNNEIRFRGALNVKWYYFYRNTKKIIENIRYE